MQPHASKPSPSAPTTSQPPEPQTAPGDVPGIGEEFTQSGVSKEDWKPKNAKKIEEFDDKFLV